jgi:hypothetical protein
LPHPPEPAKAMAPAITAAVTASSSPKGIDPKPEKPDTKSPHASAVVPSRTATTSHTTTAAMITPCRRSTVW